MKNKLIYSIITSVILFFILGTMVNATGLTLNVIPDKDKVNVDDEITVTVDWKEKMQAADFILYYDSARFEFLGCDLKDTFYNKQGDSSVRVAWFSVDDTDKTEIKFKFKAKKSGTARFSVTVDGGFATGGLAIPESYKLNDTYVSINMTTSEIAFIVFFAITLIGIIFGIFKAKKAK